MKDAIVNLLKIKSLVTLLLTAIFMFAVVFTMVTGVVIPQPLVDVYFVIVGFYFGSQSGKKKEETEDDITYKEADNE